MVDCDTGANFSPACNGGPLAPYLAQGYNWVTMQPDGSDVQGPGGHGSWTAAVYAANLRDHGLPATVIPAVVADASGTVYPDAVGRALQWAAATQVWHPEVQIEVCLPIQGMGVSSVIHAKHHGRPFGGGLGGFTGGFSLFSNGASAEQAGLAACARAGVPVSVAAGNYGENLDLPFTFEYPASFAKYYSNILVVGAAAQDGTVQSYSDYGVGSVPVIAKSRFDDGYGHYYDLATSGAAASGAAAMTRFMFAYPVYGSSRSWYAGWVEQSTEATAQYVRADAAKIGYGLIA
jgi:hypothetical protein